MGMLNSLDYSIVGLYFVALLGIGIYLQRLASKNMEAYFLAGNRLPWWMLGISGMGYSLDIAGTMLIISLLWLLGPRGMFIEFRGGVSLALVCQMIWTGKWHRRSGCMTVAEWMSFRFGQTRAANFARLATALAFIIFTIAMLTYMSVGVGKFLSLFIPLSPFWSAVLLMGIATIYTAMSGLYGVVVSDLLQCGLMIFGILVVIVMAVSAMGSADEFATLAQQISGVQDWAATLPAMHVELPEGYAQYESLLLYAFGFLVLNKLIIGGFGTGHEPQFFAARNERECGKLACLWAALMALRWPMMMGYAILGIYMVQDYFPAETAVADAAQLIQQHMTVSEASWREALAGLRNTPGNYAPELITGLEQVLGADWAAKLELVGYHGTVDPERILPAVLLNKIPGGFRGLILVTLLAASMSTFDMTMNKSAAMFTNDIYKQFLRPRAQNRELVYVTYTFCVIVVIVAFAMAYNIPNINTIWGWITMGLWSGIGMPLFLRFYWWRFNGAGYAAGIFGGVAAALAVLTYNTSVEQTHPGAALSEITQFLILTPVSFLAAVIGTYASKPTDHETLAHFYRKTRPFGFWKPLRNSLSDEQQQAARREHVNDMIALPFVFVWMVTLYLMPMQLLIKQYVAFTITLILFVLSLVGVYVFWYRNLPAAEASVGTEAEASGSGAIVS